MCMNIGDWIMQFLATTKFISVVLVTLNSCSYLKNLKNTQLKDPWLNNPENNRELIILKYVYLILIPLCILGF